MHILGIDPGLNITGYGLLKYDRRGFQLKEAGVIRTKASESLPGRLNRIYQATAELLKDNKPEVIVLEKLYVHYKHPITACLLGHVRGVICMLGAQHNTPLFEYSATRVKKSTTGNGHASKQQVQRMIEHTFGLSPCRLGPPDTTDALALAITHAYVLRSKA